MTINILTNYTPSVFYVPIEESVIYHNRIYTVYKATIPINIVEKACLAVMKTAMSLFQYTPSFPALEKGYREEKVIFVHSRNALLTTLKKDAHALHFAHNDLKKDKAFILAAAKQNGKILEYAHESLQQDKEVVLEATKQNGVALLFAHESLRLDKNFILEVVRQNGLTLKFADDALLQDREIVLEAINENGFALEFAHESLRQDREVVLKAVRHGGKIFEYADDNLKKDRAFVLEVINQNGSALEFAHESLRQDREVVLKAVRHCGRIFEYADDNLKKDRAFVLEAVLKNGFVLEHAHEDLINDKEFCLEAVEQYGMNLSFVKKSFQLDRNFVLEAVKKSGLALMVVIQDFNKDKEIVLEAIKQDGKFFRHAHEELKQDKVFILANIKGCARIFEHACKYLKCDKSFVLEVIKKNISAFEYAPQAMKKDKEFLLAAAIHGGRVFAYAHDDLKKDEDFTLEIIKVDVLAISHADESLKQNRNFLLKAVKQNAIVLQFANRDLIKDRAFILESTKQGSQALKYAHSELVNDREFLLQAIEQEGLAIQFIKDAEPLMIEAAHQSINSKLQLLLDDPHQANALFQYASDIVSHSEKIFLHEEHPVLQKAIEAYCLTSSSNDPKNPYHMYHSLQRVIQEEALVESFKGFRKRIEKKTFTCADIPNGIIPLQTLFATMEQRGINQAEVTELCGGASFQEVKDNALGQGRVIPSLLLQKSKKDDPLPLTAMYLYSILKRIAEADDTRQQNKLSQRESQLLKFASMVKECATGQTDAIEQYYINTIGMGSINSSQNKIEETIDHAVQMALKKALASDALLRQLIGRGPKQQSHQTLYLQNRYHRQIGLIHSLRFDRHSGVIDSALIEKNYLEAIEIIKQHLHLIETTKQLLDQSLLGSQGLKITYMEFIAYFEKEFGLTADKYRDYVEFDGEMNPVGVTPFAVTNLLKKLAYIE
jgi:hypothetical protein